MNGRGQQLPSVCHSDGILLSIHDMVNDHQVVLLVSHYERFQQKLFVWENFTKKEYRKPCIFASLFLQAIMFEFF